MTASASPYREPHPSAGVIGPVSPQLAVVLARDGDRCVWCSRRFGRLVRPTREHVVPRIKGGPSWPENEVAACPPCNRGRGHRSPVQWLDEVRARGRVPRDDVIEAALRRVAERIVREGGQRRIRGYVRAELRKLGAGDVLPG